MISSSSLAYAWQKHWLGLWSGSVGFCIIVSDLYIVVHWSCGMLRILEWGCLLIHPLIEGKRQGMRIFLWYFYYLLSITAWGDHWFVLFLGGRGLWSQNIDKKTTHTAGVTYWSHLPSIERLDYHLHHVIIPSKNHCGAMRRLIFERFVWSIKTHCDYAERLFWQYLT